MSARTGENKVLDCFLQGFPSEVSWNINYMGIPRQRENVCVFKHGGEVTFLIAFPYLLDHDHGAFPYPFFEEMLKFLPPAPYSC